MKRKNNSYLNCVNCSPWGVTILLGYLIVTRASKKSIIKSTQQRGRRKDKEGKPEFKPKK
jgi:hypothetical protein